MRSRQSSLPCDSRARESGNDGLPVVFLRARPGLAKCVLMASAAAFTAVSPEKGVGDKYSGVGEVAGGRTPARSPSPSVDQMRGRR